MNEKIYKILSDIQPANDFSYSKNFVEDGLLDSFDIISLVIELENVFGVKVPGVAVVPENFSSVESIVILIGGLRD